MHLPYTVWLRQDEWRKELEALIAEIPTVLKDDVKEEEDRELAIERLRDAIAKRWVAVRNIASTAHATEVEEAIQSTKVVIAGLVSKYGAELVFAPIADLWQPVVPTVAEAIVVQGAAPGDEEAEEDATSSRKSTVSSEKMLPHDIKYLATKHGVWTCLVVSWWLVVAGSLFHVCSCRVDTAFLIRCVWDSLHKCQNYLGISQNLGSWRKRCSWRIPQLPCSCRSLPDEDQIHTMVHQKLLWGLHAVGWGIGDGHGETCTWLVLRTPKCSYIYIYIIYVNMGSLSL